MPQDSYYNIKSKEINYSSDRSSDRSDSDVNDLIQARKRLQISLLNFQSALHRVAVGETKSEIDKVIQKPIVEECGIIT